MSLREISVGCDFQRQFVLADVSPTTGVETAVSSGTVTGFLATSKSSTASAADPTLSVAAVYIGGSNGFVAGTWQVTIDASVMLATLLDSLFTSAKPYFFAVYVGGVRKVEPLKYTPSSAATIG